MTTSPPSSAGPAEPADPPPAPLPRRLAWFAGLWAAGVASVGALAALIRWWLG
ncbi:MAG: hypothetical protein QOH81_421 [Sphingomonadales bacterium]|jgi:hypothetical protein|nr:hypothetical protein [Sphingomonadales bacterium]